MYKDFIWDVDGTLLDTYPSIRKIYERILFDEMHLTNIDLDKVFEQILDECSSKAIAKMHEDYGLDVEAFKKRYKELEEDPEYIKCVLPMESSIEACKKIKKAGGRCFIITNRHESIMDMLDNLNITDLFTEVVYIGYKGMDKIKPDPTGTLYLIDKYNLDKETTLFVGDRELDYYTAENAGLYTCIYKPRKTNTVIPKHTIESFDEIENFL